VPLAASCTVTVWVLAFDSLICTSLSCDSGALALADEKLSVGSAGASLSTMARLRLPGVPTVAFFGAPSAIVSVSRGSISLSSIVVSVNWRVVSSTPKLKLAGMSLR